ncbi:uncharacterized protein LOC134233432, partial [Saccostrea cucullata]
MLYAAVNFSQGFELSSNNCHFNVTTYPVLNCTAFKVVLINESYKLEYPEQYHARLNRIFVTWSSNIKNKSFPLDRNIMNLTLKPGITYDFSVIAEGVSNLWTNEPCKFSKTIEIETPRCSDSLVKDVTNDSVILNMTSCISRGITTFQVDLGETPMIENRQAMLVNRTAQNITIDKLRPGMTYDITIAAFAKEALKFSKKFKQTIYT